MRSLLVLVVCLEGAALLAAGALFLLAPEGLARGPAAAPAFAPRIQRAVTGERARYRVEEVATGRVRGYLAYEVVSVEEFQEQGLGRILTVEITEFDAGGMQQRNRRILFKPRFHGLLPPLFDEDGWAPGEAPVLKTLASAPVALRRREVPGFLVEAVRPMFDVARVRDRYWLADAAPVFGLVRREDVAQGLAWVLE